MPRLCLTLVVALWTPLAAHAGDKDGPAAEAFFEAKVRPLLAEHCLSCHGPTKQSGGLRLDRRAALLETTDRGAIVVPGDPDKGVLMHAVRRQRDLKMPPKSALAADAVATLALWIKMGAPRPETMVAAAPDPAIVTDAPTVLATLATDPKRRVNPLIVRALVDTPPKNRAGTARHYATVLHAVEKRSRALETTPLSEPAEEQLRLMFHGADGPANVALLPYGDLSLLPDRASQDKLQELRKAPEQWRATGPGAPPRAMALEDRPTPFEPYVFVRGNPNNHGEPVARQLPRLLAGASPRPFTDGSGRLELARAIVDPRNPRTVRVIVNRIWMHHFGQGLVTTPSAFGLRSDPPSHRELLDWLAARFVEDGWSIKQLHRLILRSRVYQQRSDDRADGRAVDPENRLLWRMNRQRLDFEATRDALLAVAGKLERTSGGPSAQNALTAGGTRRTLYSFLDRLNLPGLFRTFDFPSPDATSAQREDITTAPQALFLMNHPLVMEAARGVLRRPDVATEADATKKIDRVYRLLFARPPTAGDEQLAQAFLSNSDQRAAAWERLVHALLQANEFDWID